MLPRSSNCEPAVPRLGSIGSNVWQVANLWFQDWEALVPTFGTQQFLELGTCRSKIGKQWNVVLRLGNICYIVWEPLVPRTGNLCFQDWEALAPTFGNQQFLELGTLCANDFYLLGSAVLESNILWFVL